MFKKLLTMALAVAMLISCFGAVASADYGYSYGEQIAKKTAGNSNDNTVNQKAGDSATYKTTQFVSAEKGRGLYFLYDYDEATGNYIRDDATATSMRGTVCFALDNHYPRLMSDFKTRTYRFYSTNYAGKYFFSQRKGVPTFQVKPVSGAVFNNVNTISYVFDIQYNQGTDIPLTVVKVLFNSVGYNVMGISPEGFVTSGSSAYNTANIAKVETGKEYTFSIVLETVENADGTYNVYKKIYMKDNSVENAEFENVYFAQYKSNTTLSTYKFQEFDIEFYPYTVEELKDETFYEKLVTTKGDEYNYYVGGYNTSDTSLQPNSTINWKYQMKNVDFYIDDLTVYAGNYNSNKTTSVTDEENLKFYTSSSVNETLIPGNQMIIVTADATDEATVTGGKIVVASYNAKGVLQTVVFEDLTITKGNITETLVKIPKVDEYGAIYKVMYLDDLGNLVPLSEAVSFVQPIIWTDTAVAQ